MKVPCSTLTLSILLGCFLDSSTPSEQYPVNRDKPLEPREALFVFLTRHIQRYARNLLQKVLTAPNRCSFAVLGIALPNSC